MCVIYAVPGKSVSWMKGLDDDIWVWVMGEHQNDKPYDQVCDEIMAQRAALQAQREAEELRYNNYIIAFINEATTIII